MGFVILLSVIACVLTGVAVGLWYGRNHQSKTSNTTQSEELTNIQIQIDQLTNLYEQRKQETIIKLQREYDERKRTDDERLSQYYEEKKNLIEEKILSEEKNIDEKLSQNLAKKTQEFEFRLDESKRNLEDEFDIFSANYHQHKNKLSDELAALHLQRQVAIKMAKEEAELQSQEKFYCLQLKEEDLDDIYALKKVEKSLHNKEVLNKLIYKVYFEKPYTDLVGRVVGKNKITGIYKITNLNDKKVYIGQAVDISERWKQHIKRALGAEPITQNKLYPAMSEEGVWNFSFEIVEQCSKAELNEKEQYWQQFFGAKEYGYSIK